MKKIIHIASDEKFINSAYWQFNEVYPQQNIFYLLVDNIDDELKHVQLNEDFILIEKDLKKLRALTNKFANNEIIIFHGLDYFRSFLMNNIQVDCKIIWILWGKEVYINPRIIAEKELYGKLTYSSFIANSVKKKLLIVFKNSFRQFYYQIKDKTDGPHLSIYKAIKKADYCGILYKEEFDFVKERIHTKVQYVSFSYYPIELMVKDKNTRVKSNNILLGNSATETNNHLEAFHLLKKLPLREQKIIVPLSYGNHEYGDAIAKKGKEILPNNFEPLVDFMPLHEYNEFVENCGIVIMNHYRQQAVGNVLTMLWMGAKVYLDERNTLYSYLKRIGVYIYSIQQDLQIDNPEVFTLLERGFQDANREILKKEISQKVLLNKLQKQLKIIME